MSGEKIEVRAILLNEKKKDWVKEQWQKKLCIPSLSWLPGPLWSRGMVPVRIPSMGPINLFANHLYLIDILETILLCAKT